MTKQNAAVQEGLAVAIAYPPPRAAPAYVLKKSLMKMVDLGVSHNGGRMIASLESMRASSPTHLKAPALLTDDDDRLSWMVGFFLSISLFSSSLSLSTLDDQRIAERTSVGSENVRGD